MQLKAFTGWVKYQLYTKTSELSPWTHLNKFPWHQTILMLSKCDKKVCDMFEFYSRKIIPYEKREVNKLFWWQ